MYSKLLLSFHAESICRTYLVTLYMLIRRSILPHSTWIVLLEFCVIKFVNPSMIFYCKTLFAKHSCGITF